MIRFLRNWIAVLILVFPVWAAAETPHQVVQRVTDDLLHELNTNKEQYKRNPQAFYEALDRVFGPNVDVDGIARSVMTVKYTRRASEQQMDRFEQAFKDSLMRFYGNALLEYTEQGIRLLPAGRQREADRATVNMEVIGVSGNIYPVSYTMVTLEGRWALRNVIVNGINVGKLFRDQFAAAMQDYNDDLDKVIEHWGEYVARTKSITQTSQ